MCKLLIGFILFAMQLPGGLYAQQKHNMRTLKKEIIEEFSSQKEDFALAFYDLQSGKHLYINQSAWRAHKNKGEMCKRSNVIRMARARTVVDAGAKVAAHL